MKTLKTVEQSVSVVIPTFRREASLPFAIRSALCQGSFVNEVIVVDDNRDDVHSERVRHVVEELDDHRVVYLQNRGMSGGSASRNVGIKQACSNLIAFLDDDDYWLEGKIAAQLALMKPGIVGVDCGYIERDDAWGLLIEIVGDGREKIQAEMLAGYCPTSTSLVLLRRDIALRAGLFDESMASFEDYDFWLRCAAMGKFANLRQPKCVYVQHSGFRLSVAIEGRMRGLDQLIERWGAQIGGPNDIVEFRRRWRANALVVNARRALSMNRVESFEHALAALREAPGQRHAWQAVLFCAIGFRAARLLSRVRYARRNLSLESKLAIGKFHQLVQTCSSHLP